MNNEKVLECLDALDNCADELAFFDENNYVAKEWESAYCSEVKDLRSVLDALRVALKLPR